MKKNVHEFLAEKNCKGGNSIQWVEHQADSSTVALSLGFISASLS